MRPPARLNLAVCLSLFAFTLGVAGQTPPLPSTKGPDAAPYAQEPLVILDRGSITTMHADGTGTRDDNLAVRLQSDAMVRQFGIITVSFASASEHATFLYARVRHADGSVNETPVTEAIEQVAPITQQAPFYSDLKTLQLPVRSLRIGDTLEWKARLDRTKPEAPGQFWGQDAFFRAGVVVLNETVELHVPAATHLTLWTNPEIAPPNDSTSGNDRVLRWTHHQLEPTAGPEAQATAETLKKKLLTPDQELDTRKGVLPSLAWSTFPDWQSVGAWYRGLEGDRIRPDPTIAARVTQLTTGKTTELEKAQAVYDYVGTRIRYVGVAFGIGRYQPHSAAEVLANEYGDCKDKHTLLAAMLTQLGLHPEAVLIGQGIRFNPAVPSPGAFNHLVTRVTLDGKPVWLDTTAEVAPWNTLLPAIRDQQALVVPDAATAHLEQTPALAPGLEYAKLSATETLDKDFTSDAKITMTFHDDDEIGLRSVLRGVSPAKYLEFTQGLMAGLGYGGTVSEPEISRADDLEQPFTISFRYKRVKEADWGADRVTAPFMPIVLPVIDEKTPPVASIELGQPRTETSTVSITFPPGWSAEVPEATHAKAPYAKSDTTYRLADGVLTATRTLTVLQNRLPATQWKEYKTWSEQAGVGSYPYIQLIRTSTGKGSSPIKDPPKTVAAEPPDSPSGRSAQQLVAAAGEQLRILNTAEATRLLDQAKALDEKQRMLWSSYAAVAAYLGQITQATEDLQKELAQHPDELQLNAFMANLQHMRQHDNDALITLHGWAAAAPGDPAPTVALMAMLQQLKRENEAIDAGSAALKTLPSDGPDLTQLRLTLAFLQERAGKKAEAAATVLPIATTVTGPSQRNTVAYTLADAGLELPRDEGIQRGVLTQLDDETGSWTLDEQPALLTAQTNLIVAAWDTMGWILYRRGQMPEALRYLSAAWHNDPTSTVAEHLSKIDAAMHRPNATDSGNTQSLRTFPLGPAHGRHGTAELRLLLAGGKVVRSEPDLPPVVPGAPAPPAKAAPDLRDPAELVKTADLHALFPEGSHAQLVRKGIVNCAGEKCQLILEPLSRR